MDDQFSRWLKATTHSKLCELNLEFFSHPELEAPYHPASITEGEMNDQVAHLARLNKLGFFTVGSLDTVTPKPTLHEEYWEEWRQRAEVGAYFIATGTNVSRLLRALEKQDVIVQMARVHPFEILSEPWSEGVILAECRRSKKKTDLSKQPWQIMATAQPSARDECAQMVNEIFKGCKPMQSRDLYFVKVIAPTWDSKLNPLQALEKAAKNIGFGKWRMRFRRLTIASVWCCRRSG